MKLTDIKSLNENPTDFRLRSESFRVSVRIVFDYLGIENTMKNFKKFDKMLEWTTFAHNILNPVKRARVEPLWNGQGIGRNITVELPGRTHNEAMKNLDKKHYIFSSWA